MQNHSKYIILESCSSTPLLERADELWVWFEHEDLPIPRAQTKKGLVGPVSSLCRIFFSHPPVYQIQLPPFIAFEAVTPIQMGFVGLQTLNSLHLLQRTVSMSRDGVSRGFVIAAVLCIKRVLGSSIKIWAWYALNNKILFYSRLSIVPLARTLPIFCRWWMMMSILLNEKWVEA
jgi:hypothetical protein